MTPGLSVTAQHSSVLDWPPHQPRGQPTTQPTSLRATQTAGQHTRQPSSLLMLELSEQPTTQTTALLTSKPTSLPADQPLLMLVFDTTMVTGPYHITHSRTYRILTHGLSALDIPSVDTNICYKISLSQRLSVLDRIVTPPTNFCYKTSLSQRLSVSDRVVL